MKRCAFLLAGGLLALFGWMAASVSNEHSTTADEIFHLTAGYAYWQFGDYRLHAENGHFPQRWGAIPLLWQGPTFPSTAQPAWQNADAAEIGFQFFYEKGNDLARMLRSARAMNALLGIALGVLVFLWSRSLFGAAGALVSVATFVFCPNLLAHAGLVTSDIAACLGFIAAMLTSWRLLHRITLGRVLTAGAAFGLLALAKFSAVLLAPMLLLLVAARCTRASALPVKIGAWRTRLSRPAAVAALISAQATAIIVAAVVVWAAFGFRFQATPAAAGDTARFNQPWTLFYPPEIAPTLPLRVTQTALKLHLLPEAYLYGLAHTLQFAKGRPAFFMGEYRSTGWREFFPVVFLLKTPLTVFGLLALAVLAIATQRPRRRALFYYRLIPLLALLAVYWVFAVTSPLNIGHRHILVTYPVIAILAGGVALSFQRRWRMVVTGVLIAGQAWTSLAARPHYLAYFNPLLGGPANAYRYFVDSSLDWGQDLPSLARWITTHARGEKVFLSYFGSGYPPHHGIRATRLGDSFFDLRAREVLPVMSGGIYCISATMFQQAYTLVRHGWTPEHERRYRELGQKTEGLHVEPNSTSRDAVIAWMLELEQLRFGRLCAGLQRRSPDDQVGYSILIFRLTDADVRQLLNGTPPFTP